MPQTCWWWIRHAPVINPGGRVYGQTDVPADTSDAAAFAALAQRLPRDAVWLTTQLRRTRQTAEAIHAALEAAGLARPALDVEPEFIEQNFGGWQGRTYAEIGAYGLGAGQAAGGGVTGHRFWLAPAHETPPGGESFVTVISRVAAAIERRMELHAGRNIVVVAHGGTIRAALAKALDLPPETALAFSVDNLSLTRLDRVDGPGPGHGWRVGPVNLPPL
jgi:alpha-ribazole phosphatase